ncbi:MAG: SUMF1/EgtB/PvdO family nonheme iron enzyme [Proteobacteria bacterium]|jgi:formylglycine-generating enzyme required for sulfatase activity|nr:SUMF1/EgtB/PvdO family nonheme iron enzyme [Pseudomonadota bacterium]
MYHWMLGLLLWGCPTPSQPTTTKDTDHTDDTDDTDDTDTDGVDTALIFTCSNDMAFIEKGPFLFSDWDTEISLPNYCLDLTEVTVEAWLECVDAKGCESHDAWAMCQTPDEEMSPNQCVAGREDHPANYIDWYRAEAFCRWAGKRLPTTEEWEKGVRRVDGRSYPWGEVLECSRAHQGRGPVFDDCVGYGGLPSRPVAVGTYPDGVSPYGILDGSGNVKEWVDIRKDKTVLPPDNSAVGGRPRSIQSTGFLC